MHQRAIRARMQRCRVVYDDGQRGKIAVLHGGSGLGGHLGDALPDTRLLEIAEVECLVLPDGSADEAAVLVALVSRNRSGAVEEVFGVQVVVSQVFLTTGAVASTATTSLTAPTLSGISTRKRSSTRSSMPVRSAVLKLGASTVRL